MQNSSFIKRYHIILLIIVLGLMNWCFLELVNRFRYNAIVVHHSASWADNYATIRDFHIKSSRVRDARYHLILSNGRTFVPMGHLEATGRYRNFSYSLATRNRYYNLRAVHICIIGNYDQLPVPEPMQPVIGNALNILSRKFHIPRERIVFHRDVSQTACPGKYITQAEISRWMNLAVRDCPQEIKIQQRSVVKLAGYSLHTFPSKLMLGMAAFTLIAAAFWLGIFWYLSRRRKAEEPAGCEAHTGSVTNRTLEVK